MTYQNDQSKRTEKASAGLTNGAIILTLVSSNCWQVRNGDHVTHKVTLDAKEWTCDCEDFGFVHSRGIRCYHCEAARLTVEKQLTEKKGDTPMEKTDEMKTPATNLLGVPLDAAERMQEVFKALCAPFPRASVMWKPQSISKDKTRAMVAAYIDARDVMKRLDDVMGPFGWQSKIIDVGGRPACALGLYFEGEWYWKTDMGFVGGADSEKDDEQVKAVKGTASDGLKRAGVQWGIFRYAYDLPKQWLDWDAEKRMLKSEPTLPDWALPENERKSAKKREEPPTSSERKPVQPKAPAPSTASQPIATTTASNKNGNGAKPVAATPAPTDEINPKALEIARSMKTPKGLKLGDATADTLQVIATIIPKNDTHEMQELRGAAALLLKQKLLQTERVPQPA